MKMLYFIVVSILIYCSICAQEDANTTTFSNQKMGDLKINGPVVLTNMEFNNLTVNGPLQFHSLIVKGELMVFGPGDGEDVRCETLKTYGPFKVMNLICNTLDAHGPVSGENIDVKSRAQVDGFLDVQKSNFNDITITANLISLKDSKVNNIKIKKTKESETASQELRLDGNSEVKGNVIFEAGNGKILVSSKAHIRGKIQGAKLIREKIMEKSPAM